MNEIESTLIIASDSINLNNDTRDSIIALENVGDYPIMASHFISITDSYFDDQTASLQKSGYNLRIRQSNQDLLITLKGPSEHIDNEITEKIEIERPWSPESLREITNKLNKEGLAIKSAQGSVSSFDTHGTLQMMGLELIQTRRNNRLTKPILNPDRSHIVAEMSVDHVTYIGHTHPVKHNEIEIEAKGYGTISDIQDITKELKDLYPQTLYPWAFGKLSTGMAITYLHKENKLEAFLFEDRSINRSGYNALHAILN
ncbi:MAG: hypothetical protein CL886_04295 [Dehalococcoidia bacterium]|nr:hypothetical protein [Dehalococcoidia bacterium]|tara:strand:- start:3974 stop:4747 length:774 start_codon:yes stop_codon:yes gene_type:complete